MNLPHARRDKLLTTQLEDEVVVYDPDRNRAHTLNRTAVAVWNHCDGLNSISDLQRLAAADLGLPVHEAAIWLALRQLERAHLLADKLGATGSMTRREVLQGAGRMGAAVVAAPVVISALVPAAVAAASLPACRPSGSPGSDDEGEEIDDLVRCGTSGSNCVCAPAITGVGNLCIDISVIGASCTSSSSCGTGVCVKLPNISHGVCVHRCSAISCAC